LTNITVRLAIIDSDRDFARAVLAPAHAVDIKATQLGVDRISPGFLKAGKLDAVVVDPDALGPAFWSWLDAVFLQLPELSVLVCTGRSELAARLRGLRGGVDDWITKPAAAIEVLARVEASRRGRRVQFPAPEGPVIVGELEIRPADFDAHVASRRVHLTPREFELLHFLAREQGRVLEREAIYQRVWGYAMVPGDRSVDTYVRKLRIKLETASPGWAYVHTHFGIGYRLEARPIDDAGGYAWDRRPAAAAVSA
jgi:DNA-binding response OmpR family regulator